MGVFGAKNGRFGGFYIGKVVFLMGKWVFWGILHRKVVFYIRNGVFLSDFT
jgi:hypothetical protein